MPILPINSWHTSLEDFEIPFQAPLKLFGIPKCQVYRKSIEWGFAYINKNWASVNFQSALKLVKSPIAKYYIIATFLSNLRTCYEN
jgi:hypothetical protein